MTRRKICRITLHQISQTRYPVKRPTGALDGKNTLCWSRDRPSALNRTRPIPKPLQLDKEGCSEATGCPPDNCTSLIGLFRPSSKQLRATPKRRQFLCRSGSHRETPASVRYHGAERGRETLKNRSFIECLITLSASEWSVFVVDIVEVCTHNCIAPQVRLHRKFRDV